MFAKLFETEEFGQILVKRDKEDAGYEVRFYADCKRLSDEVGEQLGVCSVAFVFEDSDKGASDSMLVLEATDEENAIKMCSKLFSELKNIKKDDGGAE